MTQKLLVLDIDGTLTTSEKTISKKTYEALIKLQKQGHILCLASGRPTPGMKRYVDELHLAEYGGYILSFNGARITNCATNEVIYEQSVPRETMKGIYDFALEHGCGLITYDGKEALCGTEITEYVALEVRINHMTVRKVTPFLESLTFPCNKFLMTAEPLDAERYTETLAERFKNQLSIYRSEPYFIEIMPKGVDKGASLEQITEKLNIAKENVICCGDGYNDIPMLEFAGIGVAMGNAQEAVKNVADYITGSNDNDGLVEVIQKFIFEKD